jgi:hypothetical protein
VGKAATQSVQPASSALPRPPGKRGEAPAPKAFSGEPVPSEHVDISLNCIMSHCTGRHGVLCMQVDSTMVCSAYTGHGQVLQRCASVLSSLSAPAGANFVSELAGAVKRKQESLRNMPRTSTMPYQRKPAAEFGPSADELLQMRAGLRKCSQPASFSPKPTPPQASHPALAHQPSPEWDYSPTAQALQNAGPLPAPLMSDVLPTVTPQAAAEQATAKPPTKSEVLAEMCGAQGSPEPLQAYPKTVPLDDLLQQITEQNMSQMKSGGAALAHGSPGSTPGVKSELSQFSPLPTPPPMFGPPTAAPPAAGNDAQGVEDMLHAKVEDAMIIDVQEHVAEPSATGGNSAPAGAAATAPSPAPSSLGADAATTQQHAAGSAASEQPACTQAQTPKQPTPVRSSAAQQPAASGNAITPAAVLPLTPLSAAAAQQSVAAAGSAVQPQCTSTHSVSAPASAQRAASVTPLQRTSAARCTPEPRSSSAPSRTPRSVTPEAARKELVDLRQQNRRLNDVLAALQKLYPEVNDPELLERPIAFANKLLEQRDCERRELERATSKRATKLRIVNRRVAGAGMGKGVMQAAPSPSALTVGSISAKSGGTPAFTAHSQATYTPAAGTITSKVRCNLWLGERG